MLIPGDGELTAGVPGRVVDADPVAIPGHGEIGVVVEGRLSWQNTMVVPAASAGTGSVPWPGVNTGPSAAAITARTMAAGHPAAPKASWSFLVRLRDERLRSRRFFQSI